MTVYVMFAVTYPEFFEFLGETFFSSVFGGDCDGDPDGNPGQEIPERSEDLVL